MDISLQVLLGQLLIGLINGGFYAMLSLGMAVIFGLLNIVNFAHGAIYMMGAFCAWILLNYFGIGYWPALVIAPLVVAAIGIVIERAFLQRIYKLPHLYGLLLTFGLSLIIEGIFKQGFGTAGQPYTIPGELAGGQRLGSLYLPNYRLWVVAISIFVCVASWLIIEKTRLGAYLRAATENPGQVRAFGINVPRMITLTFAAGVALAAFGGVVAAPIYQVSPIMGSSIIVTVFAVVVIGGMGSILGAIVAGFSLGLLEGLSKAFVPEASSTIIFIVMAVVLLIKPSGLFGQSAAGHSGSAVREAADVGRYSSTTKQIGWALLALAVMVPFLDIYPGFFMKAMCFALFASAYNLSLGYAGLFSFGHAAFFGGGLYMAGYAMKVWGLTPELAILAGSAVAGVLGLVFGVVAIRRQGIYFAMVTLALAQMVYFFCLQSPFVGGEDGLRDIPSGRLFGVIDLENKTALYFSVLALLLIGLAVIHRTIHSPFGQLLKAIRENEPRAISLGYKTAQTKLIAFVISATLSGMAGAAKVLILPIAFLTDVHWSMSGEVILMTIVGGIGNVLGPVIGAAGLVLIEGYLAEFGAWFGIIQGVIFVICVLAFRGGLIGILESKLPAVRRAGASGFQRRSGGVAFLKKGEAPVCKAGTSSSNL